MAGALALVERVAPSKDTCPNVARAAVETSLICSSFTGMSPEAGPAKNQTEISRLHTQTRNGRSPE